MQFLETFQCSFQALSADGLRPRPCVAWLPQRVFDIISQGAMRGGVREFDRTDRDIKVNRMQHEVVTLNMDYPAES